MKLNDFFGIDINKYTKGITYLAGDIIFPGGSEIDKLIFVEEGTAKCIEIQENGKPILLAYLKAPTFLGDLELVGARKFSSEVTALTNCKCKVIDLTKCKDDIMSDVTFLQYLCQNFAKKTVRNARNVTTSNSYPLKNRLATVILDTQNVGIYTLPHTECSEYLGVSYRHLLYVLAQFVDEGMLIKSKSGYKIAKKSALEELYINQLEAQSDSAL